MGEAAEDTMVHESPLFEDAQAKAGDDDGDDEARAEAPSLDPDHPRLLVVGCGSAGIQIVRSLANEFTVVLVEPKDYFEFTPGILRGLCDLDHLRTLQVPLAEAFAGLPLRHIRGQVVSLRDRCAEVSIVASGEILQVPFDYAVIAAGSQYAGNNVWKITGAPGEESQFSLAGRVASLTAARQRLLDLRDRAGTVVMVGAGLVGVELAAELAHYFPGLKLVLAGASKSVLPSLPPAAQKYAHDWLVDNGVDLRLDISVPSGGDAEVASALAIEGEVSVLGCAGVSMRSSFLAQLKCLNGRGEVRVNRAMQVLTDSPPEEDVAKFGPERAAICGAGRILALGDCVSVQDVDEPFTKDVYPAEAMSEIVVANLRLAKTGQCLRSCPGILYELRRSLQQMTLCSLGPEDCIFVMNGYMVSTGFIATNMKHQIEVTKMGQLRNELWGSLVWRFVPHL
mmetsp:Transcript_15853/g.43401  ORF Transcript_15853/g.43401 Transcript_15853/m.43401 type:complete len:453 (-) Transcript_15853:154-1512(-)